MSWYIALILVVACGILGYVLGYRRGYTAATLKALADVLGRIRP